MDVSREAIPGTRREWSDSRSRQFPLLHESFAIADERSAAASNGECPALYPQPRFFQILAAITPCDRHVIARLLASG
jgi:hypothetical protein